MNTRTLIAVFLLLMGGVRAADNPASVAIRDLLADFLTHNSDPARHEKFWAEDLVYTSALGEVRDKSTLMKTVREFGAPKPSPRLPGGAKGGAPVYTAEDINIRPFDGFAALTFRLVVRHADGATETYRNSGTLVFRDGRWQVITWHATKVPAPGKN